MVPLFRLPIALLAALLSSVSVNVTASISPDQVAVIVNGNDDASREIADYYVNRRGIPAANLIEVDLPVRDAISKNTFVRVFGKLEQATPATVQYYALAWSRPYKAGCMSITSAVSFGYDESYCAKGCKPTRRSVYYNADSDEPWDEHGVRPSMMLAGRSVEKVKAMIDRGVASDASKTGETTYLMRTSDCNRNERSWC